MAALFQEISLGGTLGVTFLGVCVSSMLYGVTCLQTFTYYRSLKAKTDGWLLRSLVAALLAFDSAHQAVVIHAVYNYLILDFANPSKVVTLVWSVPTEIVLNAILAIILNGYKYNNIFAAETILRTQGIAGLCISVTTESMISFSLAYYLHKRRTGLPK
ncbi:hypothetical protein TRAPUB_7990 [Trametes pubescens]|uniref:Uncharacterized protein n=1 Tax=Trametes pubescens TaxID=154538 RepID=A0A1M2W6G2_TRAPU|nr:hypothetical protein TRAPUB_7990 [Trametes pubescens]